LNIVRDIRDRAHAMRAVIRPRKLLAIGICRALQAIQSIVVVAKMIG
jgi:hypothetical protein